MIRRCRYVALFLSMLLLIAACNPNHIADDLNRQSNQIAQGADQIAKGADQMSAATDHAVTQINQVSEVINQTTQQTAESMANLKLPNPLEGWQMPKAPNRTEDPKPGTLNFDFQFADNIPAEYQAVVAAAGSFWSAHVTTQQTIAIQVSGDGSAENWLAKATFTQIGSNGLPSQGHVILNLDFGEKFTNQDYLRSVVAHELGHVLGIGTLWQNRGLIDGWDASYHANTEAGKSYGSAVPIEPQVLGHWDEKTFNEELMTPIANGSLYLGAVTLATLKDIGWQVN